MTTATPKVPRDQKDIVLAMETFLAFRWRPFAAVDVINAASHYPGLARALSAAGITSVTGMRGFCARMTGSVLSGQMTRGHFAMGATTATADGRPRWVFRPQRYGFS